MFSQRTLSRASRLPRRGLVTLPVRYKHTLPCLEWDYGALEPAISGKIMQLHHSKHHQTYVNSLNEAEEKYEAAQQTGDVRAQIALHPLLRFHGGGHLNHTLFWENLAPKSAGGGSPPTGPLAEAINNTWGSVESLKKSVNASLAGIQGSGWSWLVKDKELGSLSVITMPNQDPVVGSLQYENRKAEYFNAIWEVINWKAAEERFKA